MEIIILNTATLQEGIVTFGPEPCISLMLPTVLLLNLFCKVMIPLPAYPLSGVKQQNGSIVN